MADDDFIRRTDALAEIDLYRIDWADAYDAIAALPPADDAEADKLRRTIAARDRRIERLVAALDDARAKGYVTQAEQEPPIVLSAPDAVDAGGVEAMAEGTLE